LRALVVLLVNCLCCQCALADHRKPSAQDVTAIVQAVEDEIYDWGYEGKFTGVGNTGAIDSPTDITLFIYPDIEDRRGGVLYKLMPFGEVVRQFDLRADGIVVLEGNPLNGFPSSQPDTRTIYIDDDFVCQYKQKAIRATFRVDPYVSQARRREAIQRQVLRWGHSHYLDTHHVNSHRKTK